MPCPTPRWLLPLLLALAGWNAWAGGVDEAIHSAEERRYQAMREGDLAELDRILADELLYHQPTGRVADKAGVLQEIRSGRVKYHQARRSEVSIQVYGDVATAMGLTHLELELSGERRQVLLRYLNVWVARDGRWQLASRQSAIVPQ
jgi:ketosteroid isomerase-like protein